MRCLVLGGNGMLGHELLLAWRGRHEVRVTLRRDVEAYAACGLFAARNAYGGIALDDMPAAEQRLRAVLAGFRPDIVVNAAGVIKQRVSQGTNPVLWDVNAKLPHLLSRLCATSGCRLIHLSTDCVFDGKRGMYTEATPPNPPDDYGLSKLQGEVGPPAITLRTSMIGLELGTSRSLVEWFLAARGEISGYTRAVFSGLTTMELARVIEMVAIDYPRLSGLYHVAATPIDKASLLELLARDLGRTDIRIRPDATVACNRSLDGTRFRLATGYESPLWETLSYELAQRVLERKGRSDGKGLFAA